MRYTPVELRHVQIRRTFLGGYRRQETDQLLEDVADSFEDVWSERGELADKLEDVEALLAELKQRESLLATALVSAERAGADAKEAAKRESELIVAEAHQEARSVTRSAQGERERLFAEVRRIETLLRVALGMVEEARGAQPVEPGANQEPDSSSRLPVSAADRWPRREDTREFEAPPPAPGVEAAGPVLPTLPPVTAVPAEGEDEGPWAGRDFAWG
jgi:cell division septum initiation protein DivIVA